MDYTQDDVFYTVSPVDTSIYDNFYNGRILRGIEATHRLVYKLCVFPMFFRNFINRVCYDGTYDGRTTVGKVPKITATEIADKNQRNTSLPLCHLPSNGQSTPVLSGSCWHVEKQLGWLSIQSSSGNPRDRCPTRWAVGVR